MIYIIKDFLVSRNGKVLMLCAVIVISAIYASKHSIGNIQTSASQKHQSDLWSDELNDQEIPFQQTSKNLSFEPFVPVSLKPETIFIKEPATLEKKRPTLSAGIAAKSLAPLIKEQRPQPRASQVDRSIYPTSLPALEEGTLIYCKLLSPASTDFMDSPIAAETTRPVNRNGITLIPRGSKLTGVVQASKNDRVFFDPDWRVRLPSGRQFTITAHSQEQSYDRISRSPNPSDGRSGLPGNILNQTPAKKSGILPDMAKALTRFGKETVKTGVGEFVPATGRNFAIEGSSIAVEQLLTPKEQSSVRNQPVVHVPAGQEFYLVISNAGGTIEGAEAQVAPIDQLLEDLVKKRLQE